MASFNKFIGMGNLTKDPELRCTGSGSKICDFNLAINRKGKNGDDVLYMNCVAWGKLGETLIKHVAKGSSVMVEGYLKMNQWQDRNSGANRSSINLVVESIQFISTPRNVNNHTHSAPPVANSSTPEPRFNANDQPPSAPVVNSDAEDDIPF